MKTAAESLHDRLVANTIPVPNCGCLIWLGDINEQGYGTYSTPLFSTSAVHRLVLLSSGVFLPKWLTVDHLCRVRCCINEDHLEVVARETNSRRVHRR